MASGRLRLGIALNFAADREPAWWAGSGLAAVGATVGRRRRLGKLDHPVRLRRDVLAADGPLIDWMIAVALFVAHLPGAVGRMAAFGVGPLLLGTGGLVVLCLLKTPLRWSGGVLVVIASLIAIRTPLPDGLVSTDGQALAVRGADGRLSVHRTGRNAFAVKEWLATDGDARLSNDTTFGEGFRCDPSGSIVRLAGGKPVSQVITPDAFEEDCTLAAVVVEGAAGRMEGACGRPQGFARPWRDCAPLERRTLRA